MGKKVISLVVAVILIYTLSACGTQKLSGTYVSYEGMLTQTIIFDGDNVTLTAFGINAHGTYEIKGDWITIKYSLLGIDQTLENSFSKSNNSITIGGTEFIKQ